MLWSFGCYKFQRKLLTVDFKSAARFLNAVEVESSKSVVKVSPWDLKVSCLTVCTTVVVLVVVVVVTVVSAAVVALLAADVPGIVVASPVVMFAAVSLFVIVVFCKTIGAGVAGTSARDKHWKQHISMQKNRKKWNVKLIICLYNAWTNHFLVKCKQ